MTPLFLVYLVKVALSIALLMVLFKIALAADQSFARNRFYLLLAMLWSVAIPWFGAVLTTESPIKALANSYQIVLPTFVVGADSGTGNTGSWGEPYTIIITIYLTGLAIFLLRMISSYLRVAFIIATSKKYTIENQTVRVTKQAVSPFAFFGWIVFPNKLIDHHDITKMLLHERVHCRQLHTLDLILCELFSVFQWFNPASWMLKRLITENHEFTADRAVIDLGVSSYEYQASLVNATMGREVVPVSHFSLILIKKRITMINKKRNLNWLRVKSLFVPAAFVAALALTSFTVEMGTKNLDKNTEAAPSTQSPAAYTEANTAEHAQPTSNVGAAPASAQQTKPQDDLIFMQVEEMPYFGTDKANAMNNLMRYLGKNIVYPAQAAKEGKSGTVYVQFVVDKQGKVTNVRIIRGVDPLLDKEAIRVVSSMPSWTPGKQDGKNVSVQFVLPIQFNLDGGDKPVSTGSTSKMLFVISGKEYYMTSADLDKVVGNPSKTIESVNVLKGDNATSKYGEKGANGVLEVTLKPGAATPELLKQLEVYGYR